MAKGDFVEVLVDAGGGASREYVIEATRAGRSVEVRSSRTTVEVRESRATEAWSEPRGLWRRECSRWSNTPKRPS